MHDSVEGTCYLCAEESNSILIVGIKLDWGGADYVFCEDCLVNLRAYELFKMMYEKRKKEWPL